MSDTSFPTFLVGQYVERRMDGAVGKVVETSHFNDEWSYRVDLGRTPLEGQTDDTWWGTEPAWRAHIRTHAHVSTRSQDCDGDYLHENIARMSAIERTSEFGELEFKERIMGNVVSLHAEGGTLTVRPESLSWSQPTDEGYINTAVEWCNEDDCSDKPVYRDYRAESMGY